ARGRVRHEDVKQAVAPAGGGAGELRAFAGDVPDRLAAPGADFDDLRLHAPDHRPRVCARARRCPLPPAREPDGPGGRAWWCAARRAVMPRAPGTHVHHEAASREKILVEKGLGVDLGYYRPPNSPSSPNPPPKS